jgi:hypothetical protein
LRGFIFESLSLFILRLWSWGRVKLGVDVLQNRGGGGCYIIAQVVGCEENEDEYDRGEEEVSMPYVAHHLECGRRLIGDCRDEVRKIMKMIAKRNRADMRLKQWYILYEVQGELV